MILKKKFACIATGMALATAASVMAPATAQECYIGEIRMFGGNFTPRNWAKTDGQLLPISQNTALFSLYGTMYGGDGRTTFGLPDLRGRTPVGTGSGPGLTPRRIGEKFGSEKTTPPSVSIATTSGSDPVDVGGVSLSIVQPSLGIGYYVCLVGIYPSRN